MKKRNYIVLMISTLLLSFSTLANSNNTFDSELLSIQHQWAKVNYTLTDDEQEEAFKKLITNVNSFVEQNNDRAEAWVWQGIIQSSFAGAAGGLDGLSYAKKAKKSLEKAIDINGEALDGSAYTSLGILYHKVPGWPIAFGDDDDAKIYLEKALALNPQGIDPNYFYGEFLYDDKNYTEAKNHLLLAQHAPKRPLRPLADESRQNEIQQLMVKVDKKLKKKH
jgi:tetratricopeptide (TPR) repeat protein